MYTAEEVAKKVETLKNGGIPLSDAAWQTAVACVGWPYVFAAWGEYCDPDNRRRRKRDDHPTIVSACQVLSGKKSTCTGCKWYPDGQRVRMFDCRGFTDWVLKQYGIDLKGEGCTSQWNTASNWKAKGKIADGIPEDILVCLFYSKNGECKTWEHTGFGYRGETVECSSGVQHFTKRNKKWTHWAIPAGIDGEIPDYKPTLRRGSKGEYVTLLQTKLVQRGYDIGKAGIDGDYGRGTEAAVKAFQRDNGLNMDGIVGPATWEALDNAKDPQLYTVHVPMLPLYKAEAIVSQYTGSWMTKEGADA